MLRAVLVIAGLIATLLLSIEAGYRIGLRRWSRLAEASRIIHPTLEGSIFGLMGLLVAFTFYGAGARFDIRRNLIVQEANMIGTAYLRLDLLPPETQPQIRQAFREYLQSRLAIYREIPNVKAAKAALARSEALQHDVWTKTVEALRRSGPPEKTLLLSSLNEMIDITQVRTVALTTHPPDAVFAVLGLTVFASCILAGYTMAASNARDWAVVLAFAIVVGAALGVIVDYEYPRIGLIRIDPVDEVLVQTLEDMN
jgi:hypothetical protein